MLIAGDVYLIPIPGEKTDHYWIMVTDVDENGFIAYAMLTDALNLDFPQLILPKGTPAWEGFSLTKDTAVNAARSGIWNAAIMANAMAKSGKFQGNAVPAFLEAVKNALRTAHETPPAVKKAL